MTIYRALVTAGILLLSACDSSEKLRENAERLRDQALASDRAWEIVESLTTEVGPRLAGTEADKRAVVWAENMLEESVSTRFGWSR